MALADGGRQSSPEKIYTELRNVCPRTDSVSNLADNTDNVFNDHDMVHCAYSPQNTEMVDVLMNNRVNENQPEYDNQVDATYLNDAPSTSTNDFVLFDNVLQNVPKEFYIEKLLQLSSSNEQIIIEYRALLCTRAKTIEGCPKGNLIQRRTTKGNPSSVRYAKDCYALYMFCNGDTSHLTDVFDKKHDPSDTPKSLNIDLHCLTQTLLERVRELESTVSNTNKVIKNMQKTISDLKSKNTALTADIDKVKNDFEAHSITCETFRKTTNSRLKCVDGLDSTEEHAKSQRVDNELLKLSKICQNHQKQLSELKFQKSFAAVVSPPKAPTTRLQTSDSTSRSTDHSQNPPENNTPGNGINTTTLGNSPHRVQDSSGANQINMQVKGVTDLQQSPKNTENNEQQPETIKSTPEQQMNENKLPIPVHISREKIVPMKTESKKFNKPNTEKANDKRDVFLGITHRRRKNAQFYLTGIDRETTRDGIINYVRDRDIRVTYLSLFQPKYNPDCLSAKIHIPEENRETINMRSFWPRGVKCRPWINAHERQQGCESDDVKK